MNNYADYDFYRNEYRGNMSEQSFNSYIVKASKDIERNVNRKLDDTIFSNLDEATKEKISYVACELCDYYSSYGDNTSAGSPSSFSIDGVSVSQDGYSNDTQIGTAKLQRIYDDLPQDWTRYL